jgi:hypothetical protein
VQRAELLACTAPHDSAPITGRELQFRDVLIGARCDRRTAGSEQRELGLWASLRKRGTFRPVIGRSRWNVPCFAGDIPRHGGCDPASHVRFEGQRPTPAERSRERVWPVCWRIRSVRQTTDAWEGSRATTLGPGLRQVAGQGVPGEAGTALAGLPPVGARAGPHRSRSSGPRADASVGSTGKASPKASRRPGGSYRGSVSRCCHAISLDSAPLVSRSALT